MENKFDIGDFVNVTTTQAITTRLVNRFVKRRKEAGLTQKELAKKSAVSYGSIRGGESTGEISLRSLLRIADTIDCLNDFDEVFKYEIIASLKRSKRRGKSIKKEAYKE